MSAFNDTDRPRVAGAPSATQPAVATDGLDALLREPTREAPAQASPQEADAASGVTAASAAASQAAHVEFGEDDEYVHVVTGSMAALAKHPPYASVQRLLARRRRARANMVELMLVVDLAVTLGALVVAQHYREALSHLVPVYLYVHLFGVSDTLVLAGLVVIIWPTVFSLFGLYTPRWTADPFSPLRVALAVVVCSMATSGALYFLYADRTRWFLLSFTALDAAMLVVFRLIARPLASMAALRRRILIVGTGRLAMDAARALATRRRQGVELVGVAGAAQAPLTEQVELDEWTARVYEGWTPPRLGEVADVPQLVHTHKVDILLVALGPRQRREASWVISCMAQLPVRVFVLPDVATETAKMTPDVLDGVPIIGVTESAISGWTLRIKRTLDLVIAVPAVLLLAPLLVAIAVAVRLDSAGSVILRQERVGQHNRRFKMYKFRTMYRDADQRAHASATPTDQPGQDVHKRPGDPRVTRVGAFLRRTSLDELPQLFNVIAGDMSLVGPRPEMPWIVDRYHAWQYRRLLVPQGITGWWQVHGRSERMLHLHTQDDLYYVRNFSLWLDLKILLLTIKAVLTGKGAF